MKLILNPGGLEKFYIPDAVQHYPIITPRVNVLVGEEKRRKFDWTVEITNPDTISKIKQDKMNLVQAKLTEMIQSEVSDEELEKELQRYGDYINFDYQDLKEKRANLLMKHYISKLNMKILFQQGFKDALILGEEIYQIDIVANEPYVEKLNPLKVRTVKSGNSNRIEDSSIIIIEDHWSPAKVVDVFHEEIKPKDIDSILEHTTTSGSGSYTDDDNNHVLLRDAGDDHLLNDFLHMAEINGHTFGSDYTDEDGNVRVLRVYWKSLKKVLKVKYYDDLGDVQYKIRSEEYIPDEAMGEEATSMWVNEMWEGTKIGKDIYLQMKPRDTQFSRLNNPSKCHAGIIGQINNTNQRKAVSLMDRMKNYQYMYDAVWDRLNKAIATNYGKIFELDISKIPANWEVEKWMHFAVTNKIAVIDSFKEGNHGASTGKLAGSMNTQGGRSIDMETGSYIQQNNLENVFLRNIVVLSFEDPVN